MVTALLASIWLSAAAAAVAPKVSPRVAPTPSQAPPPAVGSIWFEDFTNEEIKRNDQRWVKADWRWRYALPAAEYKLRFYLAWGRRRRGQWESASGPTKVDITVDKVPMEGQLLLDLPWSGRAVKLYVWKPDRTGERFADVETFIRSWHVRVVPDRLAVVVGEEITLGDVAAWRDHDNWAAELRLTFLPAEPAAPPAPTAAPAAPTEVPKTP